MLYTVVMYSTDTVVCDTELLICQVVNIKLQKGTTIFHMKYETSLHGIPLNVSTYLNTRAVKKHIHTIGMAQLQHILH